MSLTHPPRRIAPDHLPQEIVDAFIDTLSVGGAHRDLVSCIQVSRAFRSQARKYLFSEVQLVVRPGNDESNKSMELRQLFQVDDNPAHLIRTFVLKVDAGPYSIPREQLLDKNLPFILNQLSGVRKFSLDMSKAEICGWPGFDSSIKTAFLDLHTSQSIDTVELIGSDEAKLPKVFVIKWTSVKNLKVVGSPIDSSKASMKYIPDLLAQQEAVAYLETLELNKLFCVDFLQDAMIQGLKTFKAAIESYGDVLKTWKILQRISNSLETLVLHDVLASFDSVAPKHDMSDLCFPNLRHVEIRELHLDIRLDSVDILSDVLVIFVSGGCISSISLAFRFCIGGHDMARSYEEDCMHPKSWSKLDKALAAASYLQRIDVKLTLDYGFVVPTRAIQDSIMEAREGWTQHNIFPRLSANRTSIIDLSATIVGLF